MANDTNRILGLAGKTGLIRTRDVVREGIARVALTRLVRKGRLERLGRGLYAVPGADVSEHNSLAAACARVPHGIVCLLSALRFHEMTTQAPFEVWLAIHRKKRRPRVDHLPLRIVYFSEEALSRGVQERVIDGVTVGITDPARTVVDCFLYRNKIGLDVAIEALRDYLRLRMGPIDELWEVARFRRVRTVLRPYLEAIA